MNLRILRTLTLVLIPVLANQAFAQSEVADAAMQGNSSEIKLLLQDGFDVNAGQNDGATALHWAAYHGDEALAELLLEAGANPSAVNRNGSTPLWLAADRGDAQVIEVLLDAGANANEPLPLGRRPLMLAARSGSVDAVSILLDRGADANASEDNRGTTALMQAADQGHAEAMAILIAHGANISAGSAPVMRDGRTAALGNSKDPRNAVRRQVIAIICEQGTGGAKDLDALTDLLSKSTDKIWKDLIASETELSTELICSNVSRGVMGFVVTGNSADAFAVPEDGDDDDVRGFDAVFADESAPVSDQAAEESTEQDSAGSPREPDGGELTPLVYAARSGVIEAARILLEAGADVNQVSRYGWSPLLAATQNRNYEMGKFLLEHGADVNLANKGGWTPLYLATDNRNVESGDYPTREPDMDHLTYINMLLEAGAEPNARMIDSTETRTVFTNQWLDEKGATAFLRASQSGDVPLMQLLLKHGADPHINTELGVSPLAVAAGIGWVEGITREWSTDQTIEAVTLLLDLGINPNFQADTGRTALHGAAHKGATEVVQILVDAGARLDIRDFGNTDNRGSAGLAARTWLPIDYADGLVRVGVQSSIPHPETANMLRDLMIAAGLEAPIEGRTLESICIVEVCSADYNPNYQGVR